tara:strand:+ start:231 stop:1442 length:1212 start_codon:yes stop_codon:yes gene_type:complete
MPIELSGDVYVSATKASQSATFNTGNKSLALLVQNVLPFSASGITPNVMSRLIKYNNGNLTGFNPANGNGTFPLMTDVSLGDFSFFSASMYAPVGSINPARPAMMMKYVPLGWTNLKPEQYTECTTKATDMVMIQSVNSGSSLTLVPENSGSKGLPLKPGSGIVYGNNQDFNGTISCPGTSTGFHFFSSSLESGAIIPAGSGSYKIPGNSGDSQSVFTAFWIKIEQFPADPIETSIVGTNMPGGSTRGNQAWSPYSGLLINTNRRGNIIVYRGDGTGAASSDRTTWRSTWGMQPNSWNFVCIRTHQVTSTVNNGINQMWVYKNAGRGYAWSSGASYVSGTGGRIKYMNPGECVFSPGTNSGYFNGQIGHFYQFWEISSGAQVTDSDRETMAYVTDSGSFQLYT